MPDDLLSKRPAFDRTRIINQGGEWLFTSSIVAFILVVLAWGGLYLFKRTLETNAANWREQIAILEKELRPDLLNQLFALSNRLAAARDVLTSHTFSSNVFALLEKSTHPQVFYSSFQYAADGRLITLTAKAGSYRIVAEQITILESDPQVERVGFGGLTLDDKGFVNFKLTVIFKPSLLQIRPQ